MWTDRTEKQQSSDGSKQIWTLYTVFKSDDSSIEKCILINPPSKTTLRPLQTARLKRAGRSHPEFSSYSAITFFLTSKSICNQNQSAPTSWIQSVPLPVYLRAVWSSCCCGRSRCHSAASILSSQGRTKSTVCSWSLLWDVLWAWKEVRPRMRIIALLFIVLLISSSEDMPYCGHKVRAENGTQYWWERQIIHS